MDALSGKYSDRRLHHALAWGLTLSVFAILSASSVLTVLDGADTQYIRFGQAAFYSVAIWTLMLAAVRRVWLALVVALPAALLLPIELWLRLEIGTPTTSHVIALVAETSAAEAANFLMTFGGTLALWWTAWASLYGATVWTTYRLALAWRNRANIWCLLIIPAIMLTQYVQAGSLPWIIEIQSIDPLDGRAVEGWSREWEEVFPVNLLVAYQQYGFEMKKLRLTQDAVMRQSFNAQLLAPATAPDVVVLVVGESATATRWNLLGYARQTTPRLEAEDRLVAFSDVVALAAYTRSAIPGVLSRRPVLRPDGRVDLQAEPSFIKAFGEAGYRTHWYSNQAPFGKFDAPISVHAREAEEIRFFNPSSFKSRSNLDEILLNPLEAVLRTPGRHLVVLHTLGSHFDYALRYPDGFDHFTPSTKKSSDDGPARGSAHDRIGNSYDNTILYTDYFLSEVIRVVKGQGGRSLVAYFSDHGVDLPGGKCPYREEVRMGESAYRVPVLFWLSEKMQQEHPAEWRQLLKNKHDPYTTQAMYSTLLELGGVKVPGEQPGRSFLRHTSLKNNPRMIGVGDKMVDFDQAKARNACRISAYR